MNTKRIYKFLFGIALTMVLMACGGSGGGGTTPATPAGPQPTVLTGELNGNQEVPPVSTLGRGTSNVTVSADLSTITYDIDLTGIIGSDITQAHIHTGDIGVNGPIILWLCTNLGNAPAGIPAPQACPAGPPATLSGTLTSADFDTNSGLASFDDAVSAITGLGTYINVHSVGNPGGEIRGQIGTTPVGTLPATDPQNDTFAWVSGTELNTGTISIFSNDPAGATLAAVDNTATAGTVNVNPDGSFTYTPPALPASGPPLASDSFTYTISGSAVAATVTLNFTPTWYVDNSVAATGDGSFAAPFATLLEAQNRSALGDIIFVFTGNGTSTGLNAGFTFKDNQRLLGHGVNFDFEVATGALLTVVAAAAPPQPPLIADTSSLNPLAIVVLANNNEVAGVSIDGTGAVGNPDGIQANAVNGFTLRDLSVANSSRDGIQVNGFTGNGFIQRTTITATGREGIDVVANTPQFVNINISDNTISTVTNNGINVQYANVGVGTRATISGNNLSAMGDRGIDLETLGASEVLATVSTNTIDMTGALRSGIAIQANATSIHSALVGGNIVSNAPTTGGIDLEANDTGTLLAGLDNNTLTGNLPNGVEASVGGAVVGVAGASSMCLRMNGNTSDTNYLLENNNAPISLFQIASNLQADFEAANTGTFVYNPAVGSFLFDTSGCDAP